MDINPLHSNKRNLFPLRCFCSEVPKYKSKEMQKLEHQYLVHTLLTSNQQSPSLPKCQVYPAKLLPSFLLSLFCSPLPHIYPSPAFTFYF